MTSKGLHCSYKFLVFGIQLNKIQLKYHNNKTLDFLWPNYLSASVNNYVSVASVSVAVSCISPIKEHYCSWYLHAMVAPGTRTFMYPPRHGAM